jgi:hypothetical protein
VRSRGAPCWTYAVTAIVGAVAVVFGIVKFFVEPPCGAPPPPPVQVPVAASQSQAPSSETEVINVSSNGGVVIGQNTGKVIQNTYNTSALKVSQSSAVSSGSREK